jgi:3-oxoacyl-(acyl-carrier-protein) synthase
MSPSRSVVATGMGCICDLAADGRGLVDELANGKVAKRRPYFAQNDEALAFGFSANPYVTAPTPSQCRPVPKLEITGERAPSVMPFLCHSLADAIADARLAREPGWQDRTRVFLGTPGQEVDWRSFVYYCHRNDFGEYLRVTGLKDFHAANFRMEAVCNQLRDTFGFTQPITTLFATSATGLAALLLAFEAVRHGDCERAIILSWQPIDVYQLGFLDAVNLLSPEGNPPFCNGAAGVTLGFGVGALIVEQEAVASARGATGYFRIASVAGRRSLPRSDYAAYAAPDWRDIDSVLAAVLEQGGAAADEIQAVFVHGNGMPTSDRAEVTALRNIFGTSGPPVLSYKYQLSYILGSSSIFDLILLGEAFRRQRLVRFYSPRPPDIDKSINFFSGMGEEARELRKMVKLAHGVDGSIYGLLAEAVA